MTLFDVEFSLGGTRFYAPTVELTVDGDDGSKPDPRLDERLAGLRVFDETADSIVEDYLGSPPSGDTIPFGRASGLWR